MNDQICCFDFVCKHLCFHRTITQTIKLKTKQIGKISLWFRVFSRCYVVFVFPINRTNFDTSFLLYYCLLLFTMSNTDKAFLAFYLITDLKKK